MPSPLGGIFSTACLLLGEPCAVLGGFWPCILGQIPAPRYLESPVGTPRVLISETRLVLYRNVAVVLRRRMATRCDPGTH